VERYKDIFIYIIMYPKRRWLDLISRSKALALYEQVAKDEANVKEVLTIIKFHPRCVLSMETLDMIWDGMLKAANEFYKAVLKNPKSDDMVPKALLVRYYKKLFFNNIVYREVYCGSSYLPDLSVYTI
jgi:hypothetical protein